MTATIPTSPTVGQQWTVGGITYEWTGTAWKKVTSTGGAGTVTSVNGVMPDPSGNVSVALANVTTGPIAARPAPNPTMEGDVYVVSGDPDPSLDGTTFIVTAAGTWANISGPGVAANDARYVNVGGDTMSGPLVLPANPTQPLQAATKQYVDAAVVAPAPHIATNGPQVLPPNRTACIFPNTLTAAATVTIAANSYQNGVPQVFSVANLSQFTCTFAGTIIRPGTVVNYFPSTGTTWTTIVTSPQASGLAALALPTAVYSTQRRVGTYAGPLATISSLYAGSTPVNSFARDVALAAHESSTWAVFNTWNNQIPGSPLPNVGTTGGTEPFIFQATAMERMAFYHKSGLCGPGFITAFSNTRRMTSNFTAINVTQFAAIFVFAAMPEATFGRVLELTTAGVNPGLGATTNAFALYKVNGGANRMVARVVGTDYQINIHTANTSSNVLGFHPVNVVSVYWDGANATVRSNLGANFTAADGTTITGQTVTTARAGTLAMNQINIGNCAASNWVDPLNGQIFDAMVWTNFGAFTLPVRADFDAYVDSLVAGIYPR